MEKTFSLIMAISIMLWGSSFVSAAEHGGKSVGKEHGGTAQKEHGGTSAPSADAIRSIGVNWSNVGELSGTSMPSADAIRSAMKDYVMDQSKATGTFDVTDPETGKTRKLELLKVHERVGKTGNYYYSCADFKDTESGQMLDLDLDVQDKGGKLSVVDVRIHKLEGKERYTYDENDNRIPIGTEGSHVEGSHMEGHDHGKEHGGKEHGGTTHKEHGGN